MTPFDRRYGACAPPTLRVGSPQWAAKVGGVMDVRSENVSIERVGATAVVTMRRAERRNALSLEMMREMEGAVREVGGDESVRVIVIAGEGAAFSAGHDLRELRGRDEDSYEAIFDACVRLMLAIEGVPQPVIAEVGALATAAGCQLVAACDLAVASEKARFATPGVRIGLFCSTPMVALSRAVGRKQAMEMLLTGEAIDAEKALAWGLVNRVVPHDELRAQTLALAEKIGEASRRVVGIGKAAFYRQIDLPLEAAYAFTKATMIQNAQLADAQEGIGAFLEKRTPVWPT
jgi:enoyl-CoA hydratase/carnithine racemase